MRRWITLALTAGVIVLMTATAAQAMHFSGWAQAQKVDEDLHLTYFPWLALETGGVTIGSAPEFGGDAQPFATARRVAARASDCLASPGGEQYLPSARHPAMPAARR